MSPSQNIRSNSHSPGTNLLVIDDDTLFCDVVSHASIAEEMVVHTANTASEGLDLCSQYKMDVVLLDQRLPDKKGSEICQAILSHNDRTKIILATAYPNLNSAIEIIKLGAFDYLPKPFNIDELSFAIRRALQASELEQVAEVSSWAHRQEKEQAQFIGSSQAAQAVRNAALLTASSKAPTLLTGATGTGKTLLAKFIHYQSKLRNKVFLSINCAILPENLIEAELFGVEKGAFTDAHTARRGIFEIASGGTLFLDEIATLPYHLQAKLLGVLDDGRIKRLGSETSRKVDVRILAATNTNLSQAVQQGSFREDLFYRLSVLNIDIPTLTQRKEDIPELCRHFLTPNLAATLTSKELASLTNYHWPGNVRELKNILERATLLAQGTELMPSQSLGNQQQIFSNAPKQPASSTIPHYPPAGYSLKEMELEHIRHTLQAHSYNRSKTARRLDISRSTLLRKMKQYQLEQPHTGPQGE